MKGFSDNQKGWFLRLSRKNKTVYILLFLVVFVFSNFIPLTLLFTEKVSAQSTSFAQLERARASQWQHLSTIYHCSLTTNFLKKSVNLGDDPNSNIAIFNVGSSPGGFFTQPDGKENWEYCDVGWKISQLLYILQVDHKAFLKELYEDAGGGTWNLKNEFLESNQFDIKEDYARSKLLQAIYDNSNSDKVKEFMNCVPRSGCTSIKTPPDDIQHTILMYTFYAFCGAKELSSGSSTGSKPQVTLKVTNSNGDLEDKTYEYEKTDKLVPIGPNMPEDGGNDGKMRCDTIAKRLNDTAVAYSYGAKLALSAGVSAGDLSEDASKSGDDPSGSEDAVCDNVPGFFAPFMCEIVEIVDSAVNFLGNQLLIRLRTNEAVATNDGSGESAENNNAGNRASGSSLYATWRQFRGLANAFFIVIGLIIILSTAFNVPILDAYTIKKALPRMVVAVIGVQFSWLITSYVIKFNNSLAESIYGIIVGPFAQNGLGAGISMGEGAAGLMTALGAFGVAAAFINGILAVFVPIALSFGLMIAVSFLVIVLREAVIYLLVVAAPLAFVAGVLPNTQKILKLWWGTFSKALLMYPLIVVMIAGGRIAGTIITAGTDDGISTLIGVLVRFAPFFMIPFTFRFAGGAIASIGNLANDKSRGFIDKSRKKNAEKRAANVASWKAGDRFRERGRFNPLTYAGRSLDRVGRGAGAGWKGRYGFGDRGAVNTDTAQRNAADDFMKSAEFKGQANNDYVLQAATYRNRAEAVAGLQRDFGHSAENAALYARQAEATLGYGRTQQLAAAQQLVSTGTGYDNNRQLVQTLARVSEGNGNTAMALSGFANAETKKVGRFDLAPGFGNLRDAVQTQMSGGGVDYGNLLEQSWGSSSMHELANMKPPQFQQYANHWLDRLQNGDGVQKRQAAVALMEMQNMLPSAKGEHQAIINNTLNDVRTRAGLMPSTTGSTGIDFNSNMTVEDQLAYIAAHPSHGANRAVDMNGSNLTGNQVRGYARVYDDKTPYAARGIDTG